MNGILSVSARFLQSFGYVILWDGIGLKVYVYPFLISLGKVRYGTCSDGLLVVMSSTLVDYFFPGNAGRFLMANQEGYVWLR